MAVKKELSKLSNKVIVVQRIKASNDKNGNPNRIFHIYDSRLNFLGFIDEGYAGKNFFKGRKVTELETISTSNIRDCKSGIEFKNE